MNLLSYLLEEPWHTEAFSASPWVASWVAWLVLWPLGWASHSFIVLLQVLVARSSLCHERSSCSIARTILSSSESVREATSVSASLEEAHTTLWEKVLALPLDFLLVTVVHCWLWTRSGWTHIISLRGVGTGTRRFSFLLWLISIDHPSSPFRMRTTPVGTGGRSQPKWRGAIAVILAVTFFCSGWTLSTFASIRAWSTSLKM